MVKLMYAVIYSQIEPAITLIEPAYTSLSNGKPVKAALLL